MFSLRKCFCLTVVAMTAALGGCMGGSEQAADEAQPLNVAPLYDKQTLLEPANAYFDNNYAITRFGERVRERHAREDGESFQRYRTFPRFYFEKRTFEMTITDKTPAGEGEVVFDVTTDHPFEGDSVFTLRVFFSGINTVADYYAGVLFETVTDEYADGRHHYRYVLRDAIVAHTPVSVSMGELLEFEITINLNRYDGVGEERGDANYYSRTWLLELGKPGLQSWDATGGFPTPQSLAQASAPLPISAMSGGATTLSANLSDEAQRSLGQMAQNIAPHHAQLFVEGRRLFHTHFTDGAHSEQGNGTHEAMAGLAGPSLITDACSDCHVGNGRSLMPSLGSVDHRLVFNVMQPDAQGQLMAHPTYGKILQTQHTAGDSEGQVSLEDFEVTQGEYADGESFTLKKPIFAVTASQPLTQLSPRLALPLVGMGLLEAIDETTILALADEDDLNNDGISGRPMWITDRQLPGQKRLGRFGWKAERASLAEQVSNALLEDMGVTTANTAVNNAAELSPDDVNRLVVYLANLGVPPRRNTEAANVLAGENIFNAIGCAKCHQPQLQTGAYHPYAVLRQQTIYPYTDLLLHDMGEGLASGDPDIAINREWRTKPLWGVGLTQDVANGNAGYLHDGRATTLEEAILWHGGEAQPMRDIFVQLEKNQRQQLIDFLQTL